MWKRREVVVAVICLTVGSVGQLIQYVVTPVGEGDSAAQSVAKAVAHPTAMRSGVWLDLTILFFLPALVVVAHLARARTSRLGWAAAVLAIGTTIPGLAYVLAPDVLYLGASNGDVTARAIDAYNNTGTVVLATILFLVGHVLGLILLAVSLWRARTVPRWAAVCLGLYPILEIGGSAADVRLVGVAAYLLLIGAFGACASALVRPQVVRNASPAAALTR